MFFKFLLYIFVYKFLSMKTEEDIRKVVDQFIGNILDEKGWGYFGFTQDVIDHVTNMCYSILCTKHKIGYPGGSFVQAVVNNDLMGTFSRADHINKDFIELYCKLLYNN